MDIIFLLIAIVLLALARTESGWALVVIVMGLVLIVVVAGGAWLLTGALPSVEGLLGFLKGA